METKNLSKFWRVGRVFMTLWVEPIRGGDLGKLAYSEIRRFVVIGTNWGSARCSYSSQGNLHAFANISLVLSLPTVVKLRLSPTYQMSTSMLLFILAKILRPNNSMRSPMECEFTKA